MNRSNGKRTSPQTPEPAAPTNSDADASSERRRLSRIVHDERGVASVEWRDAPDDFERPVLEIEGSAPRGKAKVSIGDTFNPYERTPEATGVHKKPSSGTKRDLRKISEWLKLMRELEERKKNGD